jgi:hypothetical protein
MLEAGCFAPDAGCRIQDTGYRIQDTGYRIQDTGYRIQDTLSFFYFLQIFKSLHLQIFKSKIVNYGLRF